MYTKYNKTNTTTQASNHGTKKSRIIRKGVRFAVTPKKLESAAIPNFSDCVLNGLEVLWRQKLMCDTTLVVDGRTYHAHKLVLASCSDYFYDIYLEKTLQRSDNSQIVEINGITPAILENILECMYTGTIQLTESNIDNILCASAFLGFFPVQEACEQFLVDLLKDDNCLRMLGIAFTYKLLHLSEKSLTIAAQNFAKITESNQFLQLPIEQMSSLLSRNDIQTKNELDIFRHALAWIEKDRQHRIEFAPDIMKTIRFPLIAPSMIVDFVETTSFFMDIPECQTLVKEALHYHCMPSRQSVLQSQRTVPRAPLRKDCLLTIGGAPRLKSQPVSDEVRAYNFETNSWDLITRLNEPRHHHAVAVLGGFLYVSGGETMNDQCSPINTTYRYDPRTYTWLQVASMINRRESFQMAVLNGMLYAVGGRIDRTESLAGVERYNPAVDEWVEVAPLSCPRRSVAVTTLNGRLYAVGGSSKAIISSRVERYNPTENKWELRRSVNVPRFFAHLSAIGGNLFLLGGATIDPTGRVTCVKTVEQFKPSTNTWTNICDLEDPRAEAGSVVIQDRIYVVGGYNWNSNQRLSSVQYLDTSARTWHDLAPMEGAYTGVCCGVLTLFDIQEPE